MKKMMYCPMMHMTKWGMNPQLYPQMCPEMYEDVEEELYPEMEDIYAADERDEDHFAGMHPESCKKIMPYINRELDRMETEDSPLYEEYPNREMLERLGDKIYDKVAADMPDMEEQTEGRQFGRRRFLRDLTGVLLFGSLLRRRRRRRRRFHDYDHYDFNHFYGY